jgi:hypothetical protein
MQSTQWFRAVVLAVFDSVEQESPATENTEILRFFSESSAVPVAKKKWFYLWLNCQRLSWAKSLDRRSSPDDQNERKE